jgi:hypothetical protein
MSLAILRAGIVAMSVAVSAALGARASLNP